MQQEFIHIHASRSHEANPASSSEEELQFIEIQLIFYGNMLMKLMGLSVSGPECVS